jgi:hypothetical protein
MKFIALVEYEYPVLHKPPVKAELVLHGDRVETENVKIIAVDRSKSGVWITRIDDKGQFRGYKCSECGCKKTGDEGEWVELIDYKYQYCPNCGTFMTNGGDAE